MSLQSTFSKVSAVVVAGTLAAAVTAGTAAAAAPAQSTARVVQASAAVQTVPDASQAWFYKGRVVSPIGLLVRSGPSTGYRVIGSLGYGSIVSIECKVRGEWINGNNRWYKLADGRWAWASARYIANIGPAPRWC